jgi:hypothetical protein
VERAATRDGAQPDAVRIDCAGPARKAGVAPSGLRAIRAEFRWPKGIAKIYYRNTD